MLKVTILDAPTEQTLVVEGSVAAAYVAELEAGWETACVARGVRRCVVDLRNTTFLDKRAERVLLDMKRYGVRFVACGVSTRNRLQEIGIESERDHRRQPGKGKR